jgi:large subunit ribosomal protein L29
MKYEDLKGKTKDELQKQILDGKKELFNLRFQRTTGELEKTHRFREIRKNIARINTFLSSGETVAAPTAKSAKAAKAEKAKAAKAEKATKTKKEKEVKKTTKTKKKAAA